MSLLREAKSDDGAISVWWFHCPGCGDAHGFTVPPWSFNGNLEKPTFQPSLLCDKDDAAKRCHLFVTEGRIRFQRDCHHELRGKTVGMVPIEED